METMSICISLGLMGYKPGGSVSFWMPVLLPRAGLSVK